MNTAPQSERPPSRFYHVWSRVGELYEPRNDCGHKEGDEASGGHVTPAPANLYAMKSIPALIERKPCASARLSSTNNR